MTCDEATRLIDPALDGGTEPGTLVALMEHLERCPECHEQSETQLLVRRVLASRPAEMVPDGFSERLAARLAAEAGPAWLDAVNWRRWSLGLVPAAAAILWLALVVERPAEGTSSIDTASALITWGMQEGDLTLRLVEFDPGLELLRLLGDPVGSTPTER